MSEKIYVGNGKEFGEYGQIGISICIDDLRQEYMTTGKNGKRYINLNISKKKEVDDYGKTHAVTINTWKPNQEKKLGF